MDDLKTRLMRVDKPGYYRHSGANTHTSNATYINPDGPAAVRRIEALEAALIRLRDCDWVISLPDRMDAVREIARQALKGPNDD
jgi:hypothetical protein